MSKMKIGLVCPYNIFRGGGVQEHVLAQAAELRRRGYKVKILTPKPQKFDGRLPKDVLFVGNSRKVSTPINTSLELGGSFTRDVVDDLLAREQFDILHVHEPEVPILGAQIVAKATCPIIATFHAIHPETPMARTIESLRIPYSRSIFSRLSALTAVSDTAAGFVRERTGRQVAIIPNGINLEKYTSQSHKPRAKKAKKMILYVGRLEKRKGVKYLLQAYALLASQRRDVSLVIAGEGEDRDKLEKFVAENELPDVTFKGFVSEKTKLTLLNKAALFCSPAVYGESFGIVLLEAMATGTVTVAGNNPGYASVLQGHGALSLVNPKDTIEFARRLGLLLDDRELRALWQTWALAYVQQFDYGRVVDQYEVLYRQLMRRRK